MYQLVGLGEDGGCVTPEACLQAMDRYPSLMDKWIVDNYCSLAPSLRGPAEVTCLKVLAEGEKNEKLNELTATDDLPPEDYAEPKSKKAIVVGAAVIVAGVSLYYWSQAR